MPVANALKGRDATLDTFKRETAKYTGESNKPEIRRLATRTVDVNHYLAAVEFNPIIEMVKLFGDDLASMENKIDICKTLLSYIAPKLKHVSLTTEVTVTHEQVIKDILGVKDNAVIEAVYDKSE